MSLFFLFRIDQQVGIVPTFVGWVSGAQPTGRKALPSDGLRFAYPPTRERSPVFGTMPAGLTDAHACFEIADPSGPARRWESLGGSVAITSELTTLLSALYFGLVGGAVLGKAPEIIADQGLLGWWEAVGVDGRIGAMGVDARVNRVRSDCHAPTICSRRVLDQFCSIWRIVKQLFNLRRAMRYSIKNAAGILRSQVKPRIS